MMLQAALVLAVIRGHRRLKSKNVITMTDLEVYGRFINSAMSLLEHMDVKEDEYLIKVLREESDIIKVAKDLHLALLGVLPGGGYKRD